MSQWSLPGYAELDTLGEGGFGRVVLAKHEPSGALVAIKYLHQRFLSNPEVLAGFQREAALLAAVPSPFVVRVFDFVVHADGAALVMEAVPGVSLRAILAAAVLPPTTPSPRAPGGALAAESALAVLKGSLLGLAAAHGVGVVHRDYKPDNVLVDDRGTSRLVDFGLAVLDGQQGLSAGSPAYMAPEQWTGQPGTPATDVYAATCVFFQCITGQRPFTADTSAEFKQLHETAPVPLDTVPEPLRGLVGRGMAKNPLHRPPTAHAFVAELEAAAVSGYGPEWEQRGWQQLAAGAAALLALSPLALLAGTGGAVAGFATGATGAAAGSAGAGIGTAAGTAAAGTGAGVGAAAGTVGAGAAGASATEGAGAAATVSGGLLATATAKVTAAVVAVAVLAVGGVVIANALDEDPVAPAAAAGCTEQPPSAMAPGVDRSDCRWQATAEQTVGFGDQVVLVGPRGSSPDAGFVMRSVDAATGKQRWSTQTIPVVRDDPATPAPDDAQRTLKVVHWQGQPYAAFSYTTGNGPAATFMPLGGTDAGSVTWTGNAAEKVPDGRASTDDVTVAFGDAVPASVNVVDPASGQPISLPTAASNEVEAVGDGWFAEGNADGSTSFLVKDYQGSTLWDPADHRPQGAHDAGVYRRVLGAFGEHALVLWASCSCDGDIPFVLAVHDKSGRVVAETEFGTSLEPQEHTILASPNGKWLVVRTEQAGAAIDLDGGKATVFEDPPKPLSISDDGQVFGVVTGARDWAVVADGRTGKTTWTGARETLVPAVAAGGVVVVNSAGHPALNYEGGRKTGTIWALRMRPGSSTPKPSEPSEPPEPQGLDQAFVGSWQSPDPVNQPSADTTYRVRVTMRDGAVGAQVGEVFYPGLECGGTWTLLSAGPDKAVVREQITDDPQNTCIDEVTVTLEKSGDGLDYSFDSTEGAATARLERQ